MGTRQRKVDDNEPWVKIVDDAIRYHSAHTLGTVIGRGPSSHAGSVRPNLMWKIVNIIGAHKLRCCATFVDAGCGTGTVLAFFLRYFKRMRVVGIDLEEERVNIARELLRTTRLFDRDRVGLHTGTFADPDFWNGLRLQERGERVCVWINATNFCFDYNLIEQFEKRAEEFLTKGSIIMSNEQLFRGRTRRTIRRINNEAKFKETIHPITLEKGDLSWQSDTNKIMYLHYYRKL